MSRLRKYPRNEPCPCGSGKKYKKCCATKGFEWVTDGAGRIARDVPVAPELAALLEQQRQHFIEKHGREPDPDDPIFDPEDVPTADEMERDIVRAGLEGAAPLPCVYAYLKTGLILTAENQHLIPEKDLDDWRAACEEFLANEDAIGRELGDARTVDHAFAVLRLRAGPRHPLA